MDSPSSSPILSHISSYPAPPSSASPAVTTPRRGGGKPAPAEAAGGKRGRKKKDPNEPQKPVSAYALFFRDTQSAIKGQNPNASFGEVSKIVASMWDSLADDQKQVLHLFFFVFCMWRSDSWNDGFSFCRFTKRKRKRPKRST